MRELKIWILLHIVFGPLGVYLMMDDAKHPERWGDWFHNPTYAVPFCIALEVIVPVGLLSCWAKDRWRAANSRKLAEECIRLHEEGNIEASKAAIQKWRRMYGGD